MTQRWSDLLGSPQRPISGDAQRNARRQLARAVMDPGDRRVMLVEADNSSGEWVPLDVALDSERPYVTELRDEVIAFDGDLDDSDLRAIELAGEMEASGLMPVAWRSGRPGHAQVIVVCPKPSERKRWRDRAAELGFESKRRTRPPLSPHRLGLAVALTDPPSPAEAVERLSTGQRNGEGARLTARTMALLRNGDREAASGSEVVLRIVMGAEAVGVHFKAVRAMLANPDNRGGNSYQRRLAKNPDQADRWLRQYVLPKAQEYLATHPPITDTTDARTQIETMRAEAAQFAWVPVQVEREDKHTHRVVEKVSPTSLRRGLEGILDLAWTQGSIHITLSQRNMVKATGLSAPTVRKVRKVLLRQGWLTEVHPPTISWGGIYRINLTGQRNANPPLGTPLLRLVHGQEGAAVAHSHTPRRGA